VSPLPEYIKQSELKLQQSTLSALPYLHRLFHEQPDSVFLTPEKCPGGADVRDSFKKNPQMWQEVRG